MPDWVQNELRVYGDAGPLETFKLMAADASSSVFSFHKLLPVPSEVAHQSYDSPGGTYEWQKQHWGVKWGAHCPTREDETDHILYNFETAWIPPTLFVQGISSLYPDLKFYLDSVYSTGGGENCVFCDGLDLEEE